VTPTPISTATDFGSGLRELLSFVSCIEERRLDWESAFSFCRMRAAFAAKV
jgi:hypothetical protein